MKAILFDLDGVITSERVYWNCGGLALARYLDKEIPKNTKEKVKLAQELLPDKVIQRLKNAGINSNWDITYVASIIIKKGLDMDKFLDELEKRRYVGMDYFKLLDEIDPSEEHKREGGSWKESHERFHTCYQELKGTDEPVISLDGIKAALEELDGIGLKLGIVTGRPLSEVKPTLSRWGLWDYFDKNIIVTDDEVQIESKKRGVHIGKPDPWPIQHAIARNEGCNESEVGRFAKDYLFVGDSTSDVISAKNAGVPIICVNTGIASEEALKDAGCNSIVEDITDIPKAIKSLKSYIKK